MAESREKPKTLAEEAWPALLRAAQRARDLARQTGTKLVIVRDGKVVHVDPDDLPPLDLDAPMPKPPVR